MRIAKGRTRRPDRARLPMLWFVAFGASIVGGEQPLQAQQERIPVGHEVFVGSEIESYLRLLQVGGKVALSPWSVRSLSPADIAVLTPVDSLHPWSRRYEVRPDTADGLRLAWVRPRADAILNTAFPDGATPGPAWAGRGVTTVLQAGVSARYGAAMLTLAPVAFWAQNAEFELAAGVATGGVMFRDARFGGVIDLPQRFGDGAYARIGPGESTLRFDAYGVGVGVSSAAQHWGPAAENPLVLGANAGGFPHLFLGTSKPASIGIGTLQARVLWGLLAQSPYSAFRGDDGRRLMSGLAAVFAPRGIPGFEVGGARFVHLEWPAGGPSVADLWLPFEFSLKGSITDVDERGDNQLASVFARWVLPRSGFEVYGEFVREDHSWDARTFLTYPDDVAGYMFGLRRLWWRGDDAFVALRGEVMNTESAHFQRAYRGSGVLPLYVHTPLTQGHTHRGQLLASPHGFGGAASQLALDLYHRDGRWTVEWSRVLRGETVSPSGGAATHDVLHAIRVGAVRFGRGLDLTADVAAQHNLNRDFAGDAFNLRASFGVRASW